MLEQTRPVLIGVLDDTPGAGVDRPLFERCAQLAFERVARSGRFTRRWELSFERVDGLPWGSARAVENGFAALEAQGVLGVLGPAITDGALVTTPLADRARLPCLNWAGNERARSEYMFHFQVGSLEEEPVVLAQYLAARGWKRVALVHDRSPIGRRLVSALDEACAAEQVAATARLEIGELARELSAQLEPLRRIEPQALVYHGLGLSARAVGDALRKLGWALPVVCNSAGMWGRIDPEWARALDGWVYTDVVSDGNRALRALAGELGVEAERAPALAYYHDMAWLMAEGLARAPELTREGLREGLERIKWLPSAVGREGTQMGFGHWERAALKGRFLVLRRWSEGRSLELDG
jgi:ABC-type branched-subunit amino acid transport system substrate-binding protein